MPHCTFQTIGPNKHRCPRCGLTVTTADPPERIHAECSNPPSRGLGDTVAKVTKAIGIPPCGGCKQRQEWLNKRFPYKVPT
jgi:hypothetical protein